MRFIWLFPLALFLPNCSGSSAVPDDVLVVEDQAGPADIGLSVDAGEASDLPTLIDQMVPMDEGSEPDEGSTLDEGEAKDEAIVVDEGVVEPPACEGCESEGDCYQEGDSFPAPDDVFKCHSCSCQDGVISCSTGACPGPVTWNQNVKHFAAQKCAPCHIGSSAGGVRLSSYSDVTKMHSKCGVSVAESVAEVLKDFPSCGTVMPPSGALPDAQVQTIIDWVDAGYPQ